MKELIFALNALSELCGVFYKALLKQGFSEKDALALTDTYLGATIATSSANSADLIKEEK